MGDTHSPKSTVGETRHDVTTERNINRPWLPPSNQEDWTVFDHFQAAVHAQEPDREQIPPLFTPGWIWKSDVAAEFAKTQPPRSVDLAAIRNTWPKPREPKASSHYTSTTEFSRGDPREVMAWPMDGLELEEWKKEYDAVDPEESESDVDDQETEFDEAPVQNECIVIDLTENNDDDALPVARDMQQDNGRPAPTAVPGRQTLRQMIMADMRKRTRGL